MGWGDDMRLDLKRRAWVMTDEAGNLFRVYASMETNWRADRGKGKVWTTVHDAAQASS
jgi:hypothetical protein